MNRDTYYRDVPLTSCVGKGWVPIVEPLRAAAIEAGLTILQIKEKFGGLRFYYGPYDEQFQKLVQAAEIECSKICEDCGEPGTLRSEGWWRTLCDGCEDIRQGRKPVDP